MPTNPHPQSAKIYPFPLKGRANAGFERETANPNPDLKPPQFRIAPFWSGWYHEAALREAEPGRKG
jgi:hypothetical protein